MPILLPQSVEGHRSWRDRFGFTLPEGIAALARGESGERNVLSFCLFCQEDKDIGGDDVRIYLAGVFDGLSAVRAYNAATSQHHFSVAVYIDRSLLFTGAGFVDDALQRLACDYLVTIGLVEYPALEVSVLFRDVQVCNLFHVPTIIGSSHLREQGRHCHGFYL